MDIVRLKREDTEAHRFGIKRARKAIYFIGRLISNLQLPHEPAPDLVLAPLVEVLAPEPAGLITQAEAIAAAHEDKKADRKSVV